MAQSVCRAKRMSDLAQNVFGAKRFWSKTFLGVAPDRMSDNESSYWSDINGRQADKWWRCVYGILIIVEVCVGDGGGVCRG